MKKATPQPPSDNPQGEILIYQTEDGQTKIEVSLKDNTVWLSLDQLASLFQRDKSTISRHIKNIFETGELESGQVVAFFATTASDGKTYSVAYYNLDVIIGVGYRVHSIRGVKFRIWATNVLREYIVKGFTMDDERLKNLGGGNYWRELLDRIRDIRSSEKVLYRQVLDLYATSADYDPRSSESVAFFKMVQNKLHFAAHGHTAAEVVYERANSDKPFMGLRTFSGDFPTAQDIGIAKNYLTENELAVLNRLVSGYFDFAEVQAMQHRPMFMHDYIEHLDRILSSTGQPLLKGPGSVSHKEAMDKALSEYRKFQVKALSPVEEAYLETIKTVSRVAERKRSRKQ